MTQLTDTTLYARVGAPLWRDTGRHVLVLPSAQTGDVTVLGGGGAALWRLLDRPLDSAQLRARFSDSGVAPTAEELDACLTQLTALGLISVVRDPA